MNSVKEIDIKNRTSLFSSWRSINIKNFDPVKIKINEKSHENALLTTLAARQQIVWNLIPYYQ